MLRNLGAKISAGDGPATVLHSLHFHLFFSQFSCYPVGYGAIITFILPTGKLRFRGSVPHPRSA